MAPVLESLHLKLGRQCSEVDIGFWVRIAVEKGLCELDFDYEHYKTEPCRLPQSLFTCGTLTVLKLKNVSLKDVQFPVCFKLLKTLHLEYVIFLDKETPQKLLSSCPILEVFDLTRDDDDVDNVMSFSVMVPSLQRFIYCGGSGAELVMNTPSLKYLKLSGCGYECMIGNLPEIVEAHVEVACSTDDILTSLASVKRLLLCLPTEPELPTGTIFHQLEHLEFCSCCTEWDILMFMLKHSPKLRSLKLNETHGYTIVSQSDPMFHWEEPSSVPETLMFVLETLEWRNYRGLKMENELASFLLKHSRRLKIATFSPADCKQVRIELRTTVGMKYRILMELARLPRGSAECELVFG
jgi:hypothetical protein